MATKTKVIISYILIFAFILYSSISIYFWSENKNSELSSLENKVKSQDTKITSLEKESNDYRVKNIGLKIQTVFMDNNIVLINSDSAKIYHKYNCVNYDTSGGFYAYNVNAAVSQGYLPCSKCSAPIPVNSSIERTYMVYVTATGKKYHSDGCQYLSKSQIPISLKSATQNGYSACSVCHP